MDWAKTTARQDEKHSSFGIWCNLYYWFDSSNFQTHIKDRYLENFQWNCPGVNATIPNWRLVHIGSGNALVPSGNKRLPKPMLTEFYGATAWLGHNQLWGQSLTNEAALRLQCWEGHCVISRVCSKILLRFNQGMTFVKKNKHKYDIKQYLRKQMVKVKQKDRIKSTNFKVINEKVTAFGSSIQLNFFTKISQKAEPKSCNNYSHDFNEISTNLQMYET